MAPDEFLIWLSSVLSGEGEFGSAGTRPNEELTSALNVTFF